MHRHHDDNLLEAVASIADMAARVQASGGESYYATEKLGHALFKAAEALALTGLIEFHHVESQARKGFKRGVYLRD